MTRTPPAWRRDSRPRPLGCSSSPCPAGWLARSRPSPSRPRARPSPGPSGARMGVSTRHVPTRELDRQVRALRPWPGTYLDRSDGRILVWAARSRSSATRPAGTTAGRPGAPRAGAGARDLGWSVGADRGAARRRQADARRGPGARSAGPAERWRVVPRQPVRPSSGRMTVPMRVPSHDQRVGEHPTPVLMPSPPAGIRDGRPGVSGVDPHGAGRLVHGGG